MTADVYVFPGTASTPPLLPERRKLLLDWLAVQETSGYTSVPEDVIDAALDAFACPDLTAAERLAYWDSVMSWVDLREGLNARRTHPDAVGCTDMETAEKAAEQAVQDALSLLVFGNHSTARGSGITPRGNAS